MSFIKSDGILFAQCVHASNAPLCFLRPDKANRHGLITGATGTGKTVTLQTLAEGFSKIGVPVFMTDVKGDLTGISQTGVLSEKLKKVLAARGLSAPNFEANPVSLWDVFGLQGHPVRATISDLGPLLLARMLDLNETQTGVLTVLFKIADDNGLLLLDLKDMRAMLQYVGDNAKDFTTQYGNVSAASIGAIQRGLLTLESQGAAGFFGEPMLNIADFLQTVGGRGVVNILAADKLLTSPRVYATCLLWILSELYETLPEVGDLDQPKIVLFFDEAHLLFTEAPKVLLERIELVVRLVRSKGVGVYFVTQNPLDIPGNVLSQLGNRVQHALRAFTPRDQKSVAATAQTMRPGPGLDIERAITELEVGEALISVLDHQGAPSETQRVYILPPASQVGPITTEQRNALLQSSLVAGVYEQTQDRESAYEALQKRALRVGPTESMPNSASSTAKEQPPSGASNSMLDTLSSVIFGSTGPRGARHEGLAASMAKSAVRTMGSTLGREIMRGVLGGILGGKKR